MVQGAEKAFIGGAAQSAGPDASGARVQPTKLYADGKWQDGFIYDRSHSKTIADFGGLGSQMPRAVSVFIIAGLCGAGLPGLASFWAELLVFLAALKTYPLIGVLIVAGLILTAIYILRVFAQAFFGPPTPRWKNLKEQDLRGLHLVPRAILIAVLVFFGFVPQAMLNVIDSTTALLLGRF